MVGKDPDYSQRDLFDAIERANFPKWRVCVQIMPEKEAETYHIQSVRPDQSVAAQGLSAASKSANWN